MRYWLRFFLCVHVAVYVILAPVMAYAAVTAAVQTAPTVSYGTSGATITPANIVKAAPSDFQRLISKPVSSVISGEIEDKLAAQVAGRAITTSLVRGLTAEAIARAALRVNPYLVAGMIIYDIYKAYRVRPDGQGGLQVDDGQSQVQTSQYTCTVNVIQAVGSSVGGACGALVQKLNSTNYNDRDDGTCKTDFVYSAGGIFGNYVDLNYQYTVTDSRAGVTCTAKGSSSGTAGAMSASATNGMQCPAVLDFSDPVYSVPGGPAGADGKCPTGRYRPTTEDEQVPRLKLAPQIVNDPVAVIKETLDKGVDIAPLTTPQRLTGPSTVQGPTSTSTTTKPDGTTQTNTTSTTYNVTYNTTNNSYSWTTSTSTTNGSTGETTTDTTDPQSGGSVSDPSLPDVPKLYERKYPNGLIGVWNDNSAAFKQTPIFQFLASVVPGVGDGGCPTWSIPVMYTIGSYGTADVSVPCWVWSAVRGVVVCTALLTCRRLVFGG